MGLTPLTLNRRRTRGYDMANLETIAETVNAILDFLIPPGALVPTFETEEPVDGWKFCNGQALSKTEFSDLYAVIGDTYGATFDTFNLPDLRGRSVMGAGGDLGLALKAYGGAETFTLTVDQMPSHTHTLTDAGHSHSFTPSPHSHTTTDAGHNHTFTGAAHNHTITDPGHNHSITDPSHDHNTFGEFEVSPLEGGTNGAIADGSGSTGTSSTGITIDSGTTGVTVDNATASGTISVDTTGLTVDAASAGGSVSSATTGISVNATGSGNPIDIIPPVVAVNWMVRT
ncbi:tail fiber protein [Mameliella alba]|uniref:Phage Tail Collar n=1 Tax=Mameliella alba TaxID=561184 RepID=A0A0B3RIK5_9RHOB|nr:tail fiber protein [Mameliella alba]KHQ51100.1 Phage Tail Collar [Mameliella alba]